MTMELQVAINKFIFLSIELSILFIGISFFVGMLQRHIPAKKIESLLSGDKGSSYFFAAVLGAVTPFCSCSTIPMLKGLIRARAGFGPMMVFLFTSPLLNPVVVVLLVATFEFKLVGIYVIAALLVSIMAGYMLQALNFDKYVRPQAPLSSKCGLRKGNPACNSGITVGAGTITNGYGVKGQIAYFDHKVGEKDLIKSTRIADSSGILKLTWQNKYQGVWSETWADFTKLLPYLFLGVLTGSIIYGFMPIDIIEKYAGRNNSFGVPIAAIIGIPLYIRAEAVIPLAAGLMSKGADAGTVLALIIGSAGASLAELILLRSLFTTHLVVVFIAVVLGMAIVAGYTTYLVY